MALTFDSKVKEIMACPEAAAILEEISPGITKNPALKMTYGMPLSALCNVPQAEFTPEMKAELEKRINALGSSTK
jgi:hypothetical protein